MKIIFAGTPDFSVTALEALVNSNHKICAVYTQPDRPAGRGRKLTPSPVKKYALEHGIEVLQPETLKDDGAQQKLHSFDADIMVVVAYGLILPQTVLDIPHRGCLNIHASILPRWRGAAPIQRAIQAGDKISGVTIMQMDAGLDTGDIIRIDECEITAEDTGGSLHDKLALIGGKSILEALEQVTQADFSTQPQDNSLACYASKMSKKEALIDWSQSSQPIVNTIRAFNPWPVAHTLLNGDTMRVWSGVVSQPTSSSASTPSTPTPSTQAGEVISCDKNGLLVACGNDGGSDGGVICITRIQLPGGKQTDISAFVNAHSIDTGTILG